MCVSANRSFNKNRKNLIETNIIKECEMCVEGAVCVCIIVQIANLGACESAGGPQAEVTKVSAASPSSSAEGGLGWRSALTCFNSRHVLRTCLLYDVIREAIHWLQGILRTSAYCLWDWTKCNCGSGAREQLWGAQITTPNSRHVLLMCVLFGIIDAAIGRLGNLPVLVA